MKLKRNKIYLIGKKDIGVIEKIKFKRKLKRIFNYYKKKYNINTKLKFIKQQKFYFLLTTNIIYSGIFYDDKKEMIRVLLHEIYHALDYHFYKRRFIKEYSFVNWERYYANSSIYKNTLPFEKRANKFTRIYLKKWL